MGQQTKTEQWSRSYIAKGVIACIGGFLIHCVIGSFYQWGMINLYITSYYKLSEHEITLEDNAVAFPLMMFCFGVTFRLGIFLTEIIHPIIVMSVITVLYSAAVFIASYMPTIWGFIAFFGIIFGLIIGMTFMIPVNQCNTYFPGKKLYVNGVIVAGTGLGPLIFGQFSYNYINPNGLRPIDGYYIGQPDLQALVMNVPTMVRYLSLFYLCFGIISTIMMAPVFLHNQKILKEQKEKKRLEEENKIKNGIPIEPQPKEIIKPNQANSFTQFITSWVCIRHVIITLLLSTGPYLMSGNYKTYVKAVINDDKFLTLVGVFGSVVNGFSRIAWSVYFLKTGYKTVALTIVGITVIALVTLRFSVHTKGAYLFLMLLINLAIGGIQSSNPSLIQYMFGQKIGEYYYGLFWCTVATANFLEYIYVSQLGKVLSFDNIIYICLAMSICVIPIIYFSTFQGPWKNPTDQLEYCITCRKPQAIENESKIEQNMDKLEDGDTLNEFNSPIKNANNAQLSLSTKKMLPKSLEPMNNNHYDQFDITLKKTPLKLDNQGSNTQLQMQSPQKNKLMQVNSFMSLEKNSEKEKLDE